METIVNEAQGFLKQVHILTPGSLSLRCEQAKCLHIGEFSLSFYPHLTFSASFPYPCVHADK